MQALTSPPSSASLHRHHPLSAPSSSFSSSSSSTFSYGHRHQWLGNRLLARRPSSSSSSARFRSCSLVAIPTCKVASLTQESFQDQVLKADLPVLVGFCADWCGPCKLIGPIMESVSKEFEGTLKVLKIDTDSSPDLVKEYDVYGLPTLILFKDGKEVPGSRREGTINAKKLKELLTELLGSAATT